LGLVTQPSSSKTHGPWTDTGTAGAGGGGGPGWEFAHVSALTKKSAIEMPFDPPGCTKTSLQHLITGIPTPPVWLIAVSASHICCVFGFSVKGMLWPFI